tara:strand:+ start:39452 stop:39664 length:213 start_codon:yes stop_codon:yes gene_type:complete
MHCSHCGKTNPKTEDSYTTCCNEPTCGGEERDAFGIHGDHRRSVISCCWGKASDKMKEEGIKEVTGMCRW